MKQTALYKLSQWEKSDRILMEDFNSDNAKIEAALSAQRDTLSGTASQTDLRGEIDARKSGLAAEEAARKKADAEEAAARSGAVSALNAAVAMLGNCQVCCAAYTAADGDTPPQSFTFPHRPRLIMVQHSGTKQFWAIEGTTFVFIGNYESYRIKWEGNTVSWSSENTRVNITDHPYLVLALLAMDE